MSERLERSAYFPSVEEAASAMNDLEAQGVPRNDMTIHTDDDQPDDTKDVRSFTERIADFLTGTTEDDSFAAGAILVVNAPKIDIIPIVHQHHGCMEDEDSPVVTG